MQHRVPARVEQGGKEHNADGITEHAGCGLESEREIKSAMQLAGYLSDRGPTNQIICELELDKLFRMKRVLPRSMPCGPSRLRADLKNALIGADASYRAICCSLRLFRTSRC